MFSEIFDYNGEHLTWKNPPLARFKAGDRAGTLHKNGYVQVCFCGKLYLAHRIIWEMIKGEIPHGMQIDHIDQNKKNNKIENLRLVTHGQNLKNKTLMSNNKSGVCGVSWIKSKSKFQAKVRSEGVDYHVGYFSELDEAKVAIDEFRLRFNFHKNHGNKKRQ